MRKKTYNRVVHTGKSLDVNLGPDYLFAELYMYSTNKKAIDNDMLNEYRTKVRRGL